MLYSLLMALTDGPECTPVMRISWTDDYQMYGTKEVYNKGGSGYYFLYRYVAITCLIRACRPVVVGGSSVARDIKFGQRYNLPNWTTSSVVEDPEAPAHGFAFNNGVQASCVIALKQLSADGQTSKNVPSEFSHPLPMFHLDTIAHPKLLLRTVFISPSPNVPGRSSLVPLPAVALWFQRDIKTATMMSLDLSLTCQIDLAGRSEQSVLYNDEGHWVFPGKFVDYTKAAPADTNQVVY
jgi:hypothetical protein